MYNRSDSYFYGNTMIQIPIKSISRNPAINTVINPARNWQINPARNWQVDPIQNSQIDPFRSLNIPGYYINSVQDLTCNYFTVKTGVKNVFLIFDAQKVFSYFSVENAGCHSLFSTSNFEYIGFLCPNNAGKYNWFDLNGNWLYFFT